VAGVRTCVIAERRVQLGRDVADTAIGGKCEIQAGTEDTALLLAWWSAWYQRREYAHGIAAEQRVQQGRDVPDTATGGKCEIQAGTEDTALLLVR
jgi:hypothetical protein